MATATKLLKAKPYKDRLNTLKQRQVQLELVKESKIGFLDRLNKSSAEYRYYTN